MPQGMLTLKELIKHARNDEIDTVLVMFTDHYGRFMGKRLDADFFLEQVEGVGACNYLLTVDMEMEPLPGFEFSNWEKGYGDFLMKPNLDTLRVASWLDRTALVICDLIDEKTHELIPVAPRSVLKKQIEKLNALGFVAKGASELEYYLYKNTYEEATEKNFLDLKPMGQYIEDYHVLQGSREEFFNGPARRHLKQSGIPVENSKGEFGLGQHELNIRYTSVGEMADRHVLYKQCLKELADQLGVSVTFMAKPDASQAGSSCHVHVSLWKGDHNAFVGDDDLDGLACSDVFRWFLGGWIKHAPAMSVFYAPTVNSYKRYQDASWAPTRLAWSQDNRTAGFRIVGTGDALRIECRIPGADCNPYLAYAAILASGIDGIENKIEPPKQFVGDVYSSDDLPSIPTTLREATTLFANSEFAKKAFGEAVVKHYNHFFSLEQAAYDRAVTDWELKRYFERI